MNLKPILGLIVGAGAVAAAIIASGSTMPAIVALWSILPIVLILLGTLVAGPGTKGIAQVFAAASGALDRRGKNAALETLAAASRALSTGALVCFLIKFVQTMKALEDPRALWINLAWALAPAFFALLVQAFVILPLKNAVQLAAPGEKEAVIFAWSGRRFALGSVITLAGVMLVAGAFLDFILVDTASVALAVFVPVAMLLAGGSSASIRLAVEALKDSAASGQRLDSAVYSFSFIGTSIRCGGYVGAATGFLFLVKDWTNRMRTGPTLALATISVMYACVLYALFALPLIGEARRRRALSDQPAR